MAIIELEERSHCRSRVYICYKVLKTLGSDYMTPYQIAAKKTRGRSIDHATTKRCCEFMESKGLVSSAEKRARRGRFRNSKVYIVTSKGKRFINAFENLIMLISR